MKRATLKVSYTPDDLVTEGVFVPVAVDDVWFRFAAESGTRYFRYASWVHILRDARMIACQNECRLLALMYIYEGVPVGDLARKFDVSRMEIRRRAHRGDCSEVRNAFFKFLERDRKANSNDNA